MLSAPVQLPAAFGADPRADVFFRSYSNGGRPVRSKVMLTHHLISLVQEGEKEVLVAAQRERVDASRLVLLAASPSIMSEHGLSGTPMCSELVFLSTGFLVEQGVRHGRPARAEAQALLTLPQDDFTRHFARSLRLLGSELLQGPALQRTKAEELLLYLRAKHPQEMAAFLEAALRSAPDMPLRQAVAQHANGGLTLPELAFLCNMSVSTFKRRFQEVFGMAPGRYFQERRMARAKALLEHGTRPSEVYHQLGYESLSAFSTEFKKHHGVPPKDWMPQAGPLA